MVNLHTNYQHLFGSIYTMDNYTRESFDLCAKKIIQIASNNTLEYIEISHNIIDRYYYMKLYKPDTDEYLYINSYSNNEYNNEKAMIEVLQFVYTKFSIYYNKYWVLIHSRDITKYDILKYILIQYKTMLNELTKHNSKYKYHNELKENSKDGFIKVECLLNKLNNGLLIHLSNSP